MSIKILYIFQRVRFRRSHLTRYDSYGTLRTIMISNRLKAALAGVSTLDSGYVFHPLVLQLAIEEALGPGTTRIVTTENGHQLPTCGVEGCGRKPHGNSLCLPHYKQNKRGTLTGRSVSTRKKKPLRKHTVKLALVKAMGSQCMLCGCEYPNDVYDFHHVFEKMEDKFSHIFAKRSPAGIAEEVSRCVLLCANCHRLEHLWLREHVMSQTA